MARSSHAPSQVSFRLMIVRFTVTATGEIPISRAHMCSTISPSPDDSSFQMTIYGGWHLGNQRAYEDVYVLTIPAFQWIKVPDKGNQENQLPGKGIGRYEHTCQLYGDRQMVVLGGLLTFGNERQNNVSCDKSHAAIRVLDTTTFEWQNKFSPSPQAYEVPAVVKNALGGR